MKPPTEATPQTKSKTPVGPAALITTLLEEAQALQAKLQAYEAERKTLLPGFLNKLHISEMLTIGRRARRLLHQFWTALARLDHVDDLRLELARFQSEQLDDIDSKSTHWIARFLETLIPILETASETAVAEPIVPGTRGGAPTRIEIHGDKVKALRGVYSQSTFARSVKVSADVIQKAEKYGLASEATIRRLCRFAAKHGQNLTPEDLKKTSR